MPLPGSTATSAIYQDLVTAVRAMQAFPGDLATMQRLYQLLIDPVESYLNTEQLIIVSHDMLNFLPFAALTPDQSTFLGELFTISYTPSATVHTYLVDNRPPGLAAPGQESALIMGVNWPDPSLGLTPLQNAEVEARRVAAILNTDAITGTAATEQQVYESIQGADIVHIAAHGYFGVDSPLDSYLAFSAPSPLDALETSEYDNALRVREVYSLSLRQHSPLVVLSACETAEGKISQGDEVQGLARAFLLSGARSVIATLWSVDDAATAELMVRFYQERAQEGVTDAQALANAQAYLRGNFPAWDSPYYWAPFILIGQPD